MVMLIVPDVLVLPYTVISDVDAPIGWYNRRISMQKKKALLTTYSGETPEVQVIFGEIKVVLNLTNRNVKTEREACVTFSIHKTVRA
jgi:hypothetical protein